MAVSVSAFQTACDNCATAIGNEDWSSANKYYAQAEAYNAGLELEVQDGASRIRRRAALDGLRTAIATAEAAMNKYTDNKRFGFLQTGFTPTSRK